MEATEFKPHGYITISNAGGIEVMINRSGDGVFYRYTAGDTTIVEAEILHDDEGSYFIEVNGTTVHYMNEVMRID